MFSVFIFGLLNGGPGGLIYGYLFCWAGWAAVVATMGELVSIWPTAGGQYHWTYMLAPERWKVVLSYITGWYVFREMAGKKEMPGENSVGADILTFIQAVRHSLAGPHCFWRLPHCHFTPRPNYQ